MLNRAWFWIFLKYKLLSFISIFLVVFRLMNDGLILILLFSHLPHVSTQEFLRIIFGRQILIWWTDTLLYLSSQNLQWVNLDGSRTLFRICLCIKAGSFFLFMSTQTVTYLSKRSDVILLLRPTLILIFLFSSMVLSSLERQFNKKEINYSINTNLEKTRRNIEICFNPSCHI